MFMQILSGILLLIAIFAVPAVILTLMSSLEARREEERKERELQKVRKANEERNNALKEKSAKADLEREKAIEHAKASVSHKPEYIEIEENMVKELNLAIDTWQSEVMQTKMGIHFAFDMVSSKRGVCLGRRTQTYRNDVTIRDWHNKKFYQYNWEKHGIEVTSLQSIAIGLLLHDKALQIISSKRLMGNNVLNIRKDDYNRKHYDENTGKEYYATKDTGEIWLYIDSATKKKEEPKPKKLRAL